MNNALRRNAGMHSQKNIPPAPAAMIFTRFYQPRTSATAIRRPK